MTRSLVRPLTRSLVRSLVRGITRVITGNPYPGETLTSDIEGQWTVNGESVSGETGTTFVVRLQDIGLDIRCAGSNVLTCWHPSDISAVRSFWVASHSVFTSIDPNVTAANNDPVRRWVDVVSGSRAGQATGVNQPVWKSANTDTGGKPSLVFDGSNDHFLLNEDSLGDMRNKTQAYVGAGCRDVNRTAGAASHFAIGFSIGGGSGSRLGISSRFGGNRFAAGARRLDDEGFSSATAASDDDYNALTAHGDYSNGFVRLRVNGAATASTALASSGATSDTESASAAIGDSRDGAGLHFPGPITSAWIANAALTATQLSQLERYCGLLGGRTDIPLV